MIQVNDVRLTSRHSYHRLSWAENSRLCRQTQSLDYVCLRWVSTFVIQVESNQLIEINGGGLRSLSELLILEQLMYLVQEHSGDDQNELKPCDIFDIICGTSTGGLIAILLGRLRLTVKDAIEEYEKLSKDIFGNPKSKMPGREAKYSATNFERVV